MSILSQFTIILNERCKKLKIKSLDNKTKALPAVSPYYISLDFQIYLTDFNVVISIDMINEERLGVYNMHN
jgi:hypothetical protein